MDHLPEISGRGRPLPTICPDLGFENAFLNHDIGQIDGRGLADVDMLGRWCAMMGSSVYFHKNSNRTAAACYAAWREPVKGPKTRADLGRHISSMRNHLEILEIESVNLKLARGKFSSQTVHFTPF